MDKHILDNLAKLSQHNKYFNWYVEIIDRALVRAGKRLAAKRLLGYVESHHIIPSSVAPEFKQHKGNIAHLTAREHFICHLLLTKFMKCNQTAFAFALMFNSNDNHARYTNSRFYEWAKQLNSEFSKLRNIDREYDSGYSRPLSEETKIKIGKSNSNRIAYHHPKTFVVKMVDQTETPPDGWLKGNPNFTKGYMKDTFYAYEPTTCEERRVRELPTGWVKGRAYINITNGVESMLHKRNEQLPDGFVYGAIKPSHKHKTRKPDCITPFGEYNMLQFCDDYSVDKSFFDVLDKRMRIRASNKKLQDALISIGLDLTKTKSELGFAKFVR